MKAFFLFLIVVSLSFSVFAQQNTYQRFKKKVSDAGWKFSDDKKIYLAQNATDYAIFKLKAGKQYKIFCMSEDEQVTDGDVWVYDNDSKLLLGKDTEKDMMAIVDINDGLARNVQVVGKNVASNNPGNPSKFYILLVYKNAD